MSLSFEQSPQACTIQHKMVNQTANFDFNGAEANLKRPFIDDLNQKFSPLVSSSLKLNPKRRQRAQRALITHRFQCKFSDCQKDFTNHFNLRRHVLLKHTQIKPFCCHLCGKKFALLRYFQEHLLIHMPLQEAQKCAIKLNPSIIDSLPLFFVSRPEPQCLLESYIASRIEPDFINARTLPRPNNY
mmetsp:Transcript_31019/g.35336  ORF Transcript_31019/g.35336 Transcript_31019/m.35336 type:complete len:186 (+) Transcript_31019:107-664(+)